MMHFKRRLLAGLKMIFGLHKRWILITLKDEDIVRLLKGEDYNINIEYVGFVDYPALVVIKALAESKDEDDMILEKAKFHAEASIHANQK